jgi:hypothetical protein
MSQSEIIAAAIADAGGTGVVAKALGLSSPESVRIWIERERVPAPHIIPLCALGRWKRRPHDIDSALYPNPSDGLPKRRAA